MTTKNIYMNLYIYVCVYRLNLSSKFSSICIKWCSIEWRNQWISICCWWISWWRSTDLLLRIVKWSSTSDVSCSSSWMHTYGWWRRSCRNCWGINIQTRILFFPFCSSILKPDHQQKKDYFAVLREDKDEVLTRFSLEFP